MTKRAPASWLPRLLAPPGSRLIAPARNQPDNEEAIKVYLARQKGELRITGWRVRRVDEERYLMSYGWSFGSALRDTWRGDYMFVFEINLLAGVVRTVFDDPELRQQYGVPPLDPQPVQRDCERGAAPACTQLGRMYRGDFELTRALGGDERRAVALFRKACNSGDAGGCSELAQMARGGYGMPRDSRESVALLQHACDRDHGDACLDLAQDLPPPRLEELEADLRVWEATQRAQQKPTASPGTFDPLALLQLSKGARIKAQLEIEKKDDETRRTALYKKACDALPEGRDVQYRDWCRLRKLWHWDSGNSGTVVDPLI